MGGDQLAIPQINLSISGYEPDSLRDFHVGTSATRAQEISMIAQLDGLVYLPTRDPIRRRLLEDTSYEGQEYSKGGTYLQGASIS